METFSLFRDDDGQPFEVENINLNIGRFGNSESALPYWGKSAGIARMIFETNVGRNY